MKNQSQLYYTTFQLRIPVEIEKIIDIDDPVYTFCEVMEHIDLRKYIVLEEHNKGRHRYDSDKLLKVILFAFMEHGYASLREIEKLCKTDIRFMWLLQDSPAPTFMTIGNFINDCLLGSIDNILVEINSYIFAQKHVDTEHVYIDGTKIAANANKYSWVWKKSCVKNRQKVFEKVTALLTEMNQDIASFGVRFGERSEYAIEYLEEIIKKYAEMLALKPDEVIRGRGHKKSHELRHYDLLLEYIAKLKRYATRIEICGEHRNSYSKTDHDATFMRMKRDYMGNDQLIPGYNIQFGVCDQYIAVFDVTQYASDMDCFQPLMEKFHRQYDKYPEYPIADAGYGSYNNYLYCEEHGMKKYMKFTMFDKENKDSKYRDDPYRAVNFKRDKNGNLICPNGKLFEYYRTSPVRGNKYGRTEEFYRCEDCSGCTHKERCFKGKGNRVVSLNEELTEIHQGVIENLNSIQGALLRMNRSIQSEGAFGVMKWNRAYTRARRRGLEKLNFEIGIISCGFNLHKYHLQRNASSVAA